MLLDHDQIKKLTVELTESTDSEFIDQTYELASRLSPPRVADVLRNAKPEFIVAVLVKMPVDRAGRILGHFPHELIPQVLEVGDGQMVNILNSIPPDQATDIIKHIPKKFRESLLAKLDEGKRDELMKLAPYEDGTAGSIMTSHFAVINSHCTVKETVDALLSVSIGSERPSYVYIQNDAGRLIGVVSLKDLMRNPSGRKITEVMNSEVITVRTDTPEAEAATLLRDRRFTALPVVNDNDQIVGVITFEDAMNVMSEQIAESFTSVGGSSDESFFTPPAGAVKKRLPWMAINVFLNLGAVTVITGFEATIEQVAILAAFLPMITDMGGNVGIQALSVSIRSQALGETKLRDFGRAARKELAVGLFNGLALGLLFAVIAFAWRGSLWLGGLAGIALGINVLLAGLVGGCLPFLIKALGKDPAMMTGPFLTTITDISGVSIYLGLSTIFILRLVS